MFLEILLVYFRRFLFSGFLSPLPIPRLLFTSFFFILALLVLSFKISPFSLLLIDCAFLLCAPLYPHLDESTPHLFDIAYEDTMKFISLVPLCPLLDAPSIQTYLFSACCGRRGSSIRYFFAAPVSFDSITVAFFIVTARHA